MPNVIEVPATLGLHRDNNPQAKVPQGALRVASNIVCQRLGMVEPRPGFVRSPYSDSELSPTPHARRLMPWREDGSVVVYTSTGTTAWWGAIDTPIQTEAATDLSWTADHYRVTSARKNLYLSTSDGVRKLTSNTDVVASQTMFNGLPVITSVNTSGAGSGYLANNGIVLYSVVVKRTDSNNLVTRSCGLGSAGCINATGGADTTVVRCDFSSSDVAAGDVLEFYRSIQSTALPGREMYLQSSHALNSTDITAGYYQFTDATTDANLGAALYINDSREGIEGANFRPPMAKEIATFSGSVFYGNIVSPQRLTFQYGVSGDTTGSATGIGTRTSASTRTATSSTILIADTTGLQVGMMLTDPTSWSGTGPVVIASIVTNTSVSVSPSTWGGATDGAPVNLDFIDTIEVQSANATGVFSKYPNNTPLAFLTAMAVGNATLRVARHPDAYAYTPDLYHYYTAGATNRTVRMFIEERGRSGASMTVRVTNNTLVYPTPVSIQSGGAGTPMVSDTLVNAFFYSKQHEPEHVPLGYFDRAGVENAELFRMIATRSALWIFKKDGVWRLVGDAAPTWRIDLVDPTLQLLHPDQAWAIGDVVYAMTTQGPVMVSDAGVSPMGYPGFKRSQIDEDFEPYVRKFSDPSEWPTTGGLWMTADETNGNVVVGFADYTDSVAGTTAIYVYNNATREWTNWDADSGALDGTYHMVYVPLGARLVVANTNDIAVQRVRSDPAAFSGGPVLGADYEYDITITDVDVSDPTLITINGVTSFSPVVGDAVVQSGAFYIVTDVTSVTVFNVHKAGLTAAAATGYQAIESEFEYLAQGSPVIYKRWLAMNVSFHNLDGVLTTAASFATDTNYSTGATRTLTYLAPDVDAERATSIRFFVPTRASLSRLLYPGFSQRQAGSNWRIGGMALFYEDATERVSL